MNIFYYILTLTKFHALGITTTDGTYSNYELMIESSREIYTRTNKQIKFTFKFTIKFDINGNSYKILMENNLDSTKSVPEVIEFTLS